MVTIFISLIIFVIVKYTFLRTLLYIKKEIKSINIGDQYARSVYYGRYKVIPIRTEIIKFCETIGFDYMGAIIWQKVANTNTTGGATIMGSYPYPRNGIVKLDYEFILIFKKLGVSKKKVNKDVKERSRLTKEEWNTYFAGHWNFSGVRQAKHLAMFPPELPKRLIKMFTFIGDTVLDPFLGSGTTALVARQLQRHSIGYEIQAEFISLIEQRLKADDPTLGKQSEIAFQTQVSQGLDFQKEIARLPYIFQDPIQLNKKIDFKTLQFGSKIDQQSPARDDYYAVKEVLSPTLLLLDTGVTIRLIGIKEDHATSMQAMQFLQNMLKGQKVFLKFDHTKYDDSSNLLCYLYLKNKTFVNAYLLKYHFVTIDDSLDFKYKIKFSQLGKCKK